MFYNSFVNYIIHYNERDNLEALSTSSLLVLEQKNTEEAIKADLGSILYTYGKFCIVGTIMLAITIVNIFLLYTVDESISHFAGNGFIGSVIFYILGFFVWVSPFIIFLKIGKVTIHSQSYIPEIHKVQTKFGEIFKDNMDEADAIIEALKSDEETNDASINVVALDLQKGFAENYLRSITEINETVGNGSIMRNSIHAFDLILILTVTMSAIELLYQYSS